ncbi:hypothetical protein SAMN04487949_2094 [Halogranum gelatinilyticum]|uniref:DUF8135 domain-containing protein n=1 Tax=Halogranum gelatinilyticum TaxID=660521 RepID=A0A1G9U8T3_9EURY|nr:hypothetical protein [Halogranum gelatinilyticum]SDM56351.1 hypothetical protein SAMN04487949_2094 [Halogranum gelatinilyticum]
MSDDERVDPPSEDPSDGDRLGDDVQGVGDGSDVQDVEDVGDVGDGDDTEDRADAAQASEGSADSMPLEDLARELGERRQAESEEDLDEAFEPVDVDEVDTDDLWNEVFGDGPGDDVGGAVGAGEPSVSTRTAGTSASELTNGSAPSAAAGDWAATAADETVSKRDYCQKCPHFSEPPEATCTHEGTEIVEVVTVEQFRVRNCPMVDDE